jgi:hypothetical protein
MQLVFVWWIGRKLRRKMGLKVQEMGGNAVLAYSQHFDLEGQGGGGIVARGQGTAVLLSKRRSKSRLDSSAALTVTPVVNADSGSLVDAINTAGVTSTTNGQTLALNSSTSTAAKLLQQVTVCVKNRSHCE